MKKKSIVLWLTIGVLIIVFIFEISIFLQLEKEYTFISDRNRLLSQIKVLNICLPQYLNSRDISKSINDIISYDSSLEFKKVFDDRKLIILKSKKFDGLHSSFDLYIVLDFSLIDSHYYLIVAHDYSNDALIIFQNEPSSLKTLIDGISHENLKNIVDVVMVR